MATSKQKAVWSAIVAAVTSALAWLANTPPEAQNAILGPLVDIMPVDWRPTIGAITKALSSVALVYSTIQASHSGPATKPVTDAQTGEETPVPSVIKTQRLTP